jgi:hypothetical protein
MFIVNITIGRLLILGEGGYGFAVAHLYHFGFLLCRKHIRYAANIEIERHTPFR